MEQIIGFIGAGMIGSAIARLAVKAGYQVIISNSRGGDSLNNLIMELGPLACSTTPEEAARRADLVILSVPMSAYRKVPSEALDGKIVIDTSNYYPMRDGQIAILDEGELTTSELVQQHFSNATVIKALNNVDFHHLYFNARPESDALRTTLPIAGNNEKAKEKVDAFIHSIGYNTVDTGSLADSWVSEPGTPIYCLPYMPAVPDKLSPEEAKTYYLEHTGIPLSASEVRKIIETTVRPTRIGGYPEELPALHITVLTEEMKKNKK